MYNCRHSCVGKAAVCLQQVSESYRAQWRWRKPPVLEKNVDQAKHVDEDDDIVFLDDESKLKKKSKKRKRDRLLQTGCKAKVVVKLIDGP